MTDIMLKANKHDYVVLFDLQNWWISELPFVASHSTIKPILTIYSYLLRWTIVGYVWTHVTKLSPDVSNLMLQYPFLSAFQGCYQGQTEGNLWAAFTTAA